MCNPTDNAQIEAMYPLSPLQKGLLFHSLSIPGMYLQQILGDLPETIDILIFGQAWQKVIQRHDLLRTSFHWEGLEHPQQKVHPQVNCPLQVYDWSSWPAQTQEQQLTTYLKTDRIQGFQFTHPPLMRLALFQLGKTHYRFLWTFHHAILDEHSHFEILREVFAFYEAFCLNQDLELLLPRPYRDYIAWLETQNFSEAEAFWRNIMGTCEAPTSMIDGWPKESLAEGLTHATQILPLTLELTKTLQTFAEDQNLTIHTLVQGAWAFLLSHYSGEEQVIFGATRSCRHWGSDSETMIGLFINTLPVSSSLQSDIPVLVWLRALHEQWLKMGDYEHTPLIELHKWSHIPKTLPLFESIVLFEQNHFRTRLKALGGKWKKREFNSLLRELNYPCTLLATLDSSLQLHLIYDVKHFSSRLIKQMLGHLEIILSQIVAHPEQCLGELSLLSEGERHQLLIEWNATQAFFPQESCIQQLFEAQVEKTPKAIAVVFKNQSLSYRELNQRANQLAHYLHALQFKPETPIGLCVERSLDMMIGILGILKAGGVYVPLSPTYPKERIAYILKDSQMPVLLTQGTLKKQFLEEPIQTISLDTQWDEIAKYSHENLYLKVPSHHLSYIIYTSGTTGDPKGVMVEHRSVLNLLAGLHQEIYAHYPQIPLRISLNGPLAFDTSIKQIIQLLAGHTLDILPEEIRLDGKALLSYVQEHKIDVLDSTPSQLKLLISEGLLTSLENPKCILVGGEAIDAPLWETLAEVKPIHFYNVYGPTECTVDATISSISGKKIPVIGRPITNTQIYLLDFAHHPVPIGVPGELHIGGAGLARGYLNRPELTAEKFIPNPFSDDPTARLYKTGDLARYLPDGNIEYLGRIDTQVKLRGFRIELEEIEATLLQHPALSEVAVIVREDTPGDQRLVGYAVLHTGASETPSQLRQFLKEKLPEYMVPSVIVLLEHLPLTPNGKIDRRALPKPEKIADEESFVAPRDEIELQLQCIWEEVLQVRPIGVTQNFFELGGHSLLAIRLLSHIGKAFGKTPSVMTLFQSPTIEQLAYQLHGEHFSKPLHIPARPPQELIPLSFSQQRLWFLDQLEGPSATYNISLAFRLIGKLNPAALQAGLSEIVQRHESLRTTFINLEGTPYQLIHSITTLFEKNQLLSTITGSQLDIDHLVQQEAQCPFDLGEGPLFRATLYDLGNEEYVFLVVMHHIISDGWSVKNFTEELMAFYQAFTQNFSPHLPSLPIQYADFAHWQRQWFKGEILETQLTYWKKKLENIPHILSLPTDFPRPPRQSFQGTTVKLQLPMRLLKQLNELSLHNECTLFMTLLSAFTTLLSRYSGMTDIVIGTAVANRTLSETDPLIGFFVNTLALRIQLEGNPPFNELLQRVRQTALEAYTHSDMPFEKLVEELKPERDLSHTPIFQVMVVLENMPKSTFQLGDLKMISFPLESQTTKFDLNFHWLENNEGLLCTLWYNTDLFKPQTIQGFLSHFETLLEDIVVHSHQRLSQLRLLTEAEQHRFAHATHTVRPNHPFLEFPQGEESISARFEQQVQLYPHHLAVKTRRYTWTYQELNERVQALASVLLSRAAGEHVALLFEHDAPMLVAILGVLKAGKVYIPLDPNYPQQRLEYLLQDSQATTLLCSQEHSSLANTLMENYPLSLIINLDTLETVPEPVHWPVVTGETLAYILYTSGSTGQPKGVVQNHRNVLHFIRCYTNNLHISAQDRLTLLASYSFDAAVVDMFAALLNGASLYPFNLKQDSQLAAWVIQEQMTIYHSTPTVYRHFIETLSSQERFPHLRLIVLGGEPVNVQDVEKYRANFDAHCLLVNGLGATESTFHLHHFISHQTACSGLLVPVGYPLDDTEVWLLDEQGERTELYGEIGVRSAYLALEYWQRKELTEAVFFPDPEGGNRRIYRTGDLARRLADGCLELLGRRDFQVKIRGVRIELGEIESALLGHPAVKEVVVVAREEKLGEKELVAYVVVRQPMTFLQMREFLKGRLPEFMIPSALMVLEQLPLTSTGKVNRRVLPLPERIEHEEAFVAAHNEIELQLQHTWEEVLQVRPIGVTQNFFELGGHSLLAIRLLAEMKKIFKKDLPVLTLFQMPTIEQLAHVLSDQERQNLLLRTLTFIQPQGHRPPLFFIGSISFGRLLSMSLGNHQPVYGLNVFGLMGTDEIKASLEVQKIAEQFIREIRSVQAHGPYHLCGYCGDAKIAFEIAQQLGKQGESVAFLAFIDVLWQKKNRYARLRRNLFKFGFLSYSLHTFQRKLKFYMLWFKFRWNKWKMKWYHLRRISSPLEVQQIEFIREFFATLGNYSPQPYSGKLTLFLSTEWYTEDLTQFSQIAQGGIELYEVPGYHDNLFISPQVEGLGEKMNRCLDELTDHESSI